MAFSFCSRVQQMFSTERQMQTYKRTWLPVVIQFKKSLRKEVVYDL